ncbi:MAG TPA: redoxin domain-containing protein [Roseiflexaceae bacterium]|nr:redoxin domain-containing protein [Roseiflexaceae bacterium]
MQNRVTFISVLAVMMPVLLVLIAVVVLARPSGSASVVPSSDALPATIGPTAPSAGQRSAAQVPTGAAPAAAPAPQPRPSGPAAPGFDGGGAWINSEPLKLADLGAQGKVVLVDFWTYGCYNCTNTLPYVKQWWAKYKDQGLVIVGVHTPEFDSERVLENVQDAVKRQEIGWPVVQDNDYTIWRAYGNNYWPHFYLVDERGQIIYDHIGEGAYEQTEAQIAAALAARGR